MYDARRERTLSKRTLDFHASERLRRSMLRPLFPQLHYTCATQRLDTLIFVPSVTLLMRLLMALRREFRDCIHI